MTVMMAMRRCAQWVVKIAVSTGCVLMVAVPPAMATELRGQVVFIDQYSHRQLPLADARVGLVPARGGAATYTVSGRDGMYYFNGIAPGQYYCLIGRGGGRYAVNVGPSGTQDLPRIVVP